MPSDRKAEAGNEFAATVGCKSEGPAVQILEKPSSFQGDLQKRCTERAADMEPTLAPIKTSTGEVATEYPKRGEIDAQSTECICAGRGEVIGLAVAGR